MITFAEFLSDRGIVAPHPTTGPGWVSVRTVDHPRKKNGRYKFWGDVGWAMNWATMDRTERWYAKAESERDPQMQERIRLAEIADAQERRENARQAAQDALGHVKAAHIYSHPYFDSKGLPTARGLVLDEFLLVPMSINGKLAGVQRIYEDGGWQKRFTRGMRTKDACLQVGRGSEIIWVEGYATALSIAEILGVSASRHSIVVTFSAHNLTHMARTAGVGKVFADNDRSGTGQKAAEATGLPWIMSPEVGEDANDWHHRDPGGLMKALFELGRR